MRLRPAIAALFICAGPVAAQEAGEGPGVPQSAVVVLDRDALFATSLFGQRVTRDVEAETSALAAENRRIEAELEAEERELTQRRKTMEPGEFRELAAEFDTRVNGIREAQDAKARAIAQQGERAQQLFFDRANPVLVDLARETGALVILDRRIVIASADQVDITALAQSRIDAALGEGVATDGTQPRPRPTPPEAETGTD